MSDTSFPFPGEHPEPPPGFGVELGQQAAELLDAFEQLLPPDARVSATAIVTCVHVGGSYRVFVKASDGRGWVQRALLAEGIKSIREAEGERGSQPPPDWS